MNLILWTYPIRCPLCSQIVLFSEAFTDDDYVRCSCFKFSFNFDYYSNKQVKIKVVHLRIEEKEFNITSYTGNYRFTYPVETDYNRGVVLSDELDFSSPKKFYDYSKLFYDSMLFM